MKSSYSINEEKAARLLDDNHSSSSESAFPNQFSRRHQIPQKSILATTTTILGRPVSQKMKITVATVAMISALFLQRLCFVGSGYSLAIREQSYVMVLLNSFVASVFTFFNQFAKKQKHKRRIHELFFIRRTPKINFFILVFVSLLDLLYSIMLFYGLYLLPVGFFIVSMQFSIGAMLFFRKCAFRYESRAVHYVCAFTLVLAEILIIVSAGVEIQDPETFGGSLLFILSNIPLLLSMLIKESLIRTQPLHRNLLNFKISLSQFILTIILTPFIIAILGEEQTLPSFKEMGNFYGDGFRCLFSFSSAKSPHCNFSLFVFIGYNLSVIVYQLALSSLLLRSSMKRVKMIQATGIPVTLVALAFASLLWSELVWGFTVLQLLGTILSICAVMLFNLVPDKMELIRIEEGKFQ